jgi:hypothetical protein
MNRLLLLTVGGMLWAGCSVEFTEPEGRSCDDTHACPANQICVDLRCQPFDVPPPPDAGTPDSGTPDSGTPDSGTPDSGTPDSGTPDAGPLPADLALHFSADRLNGPTGDLPADGARVSAWTDLSGQGHTLTQGDENRQPLFKAQGLHGRPTVVFDGDTLGAGDYLRTAAFPSALPQPLTFFFVYKSPPTDVNKTLLDAPPGVGTQRARVQATIEPPGALQLYASKFSSPYLQKAAGAFYSVTAVFNGPSSRVRANGTEEAPSANRDPGTVGMGGLMLGGRQELTADAFAATEFAEVLVFTRALNDTEIEQVETYLRGRYFP